MIYVGWIWAQLLSNIYQLQFPKLIGINKLILYNNQIKWQKTHEYILPIQLAQVRD